MPKQNIEVEVRGPLSTEQYARVRALLEAKGTLVEEKWRTFIDYSTFLEGGVRERQKDIRIRVTNGVPEIIVKLGSWGGTETRKELSVKTEAGSFEELGEILGELGYTKGVLGVRNSRVYTYEGIEFALVEVPGHSYYYEAEKMVGADEDAEQAFTEIQKFCQEELGLEVFSQEAFYQYIETLNKEANRIFDYADFQEGGLAKYAE